MPFCHRIGKPSHILHLLLRYSCPNLVPLAHFNTLCKINNRVCISRAYYNKVQNLAENITKKFHCLKN